MDYLGFERGLSPRTLSAYGRDLDRFLVFLGDLGMVSPEDVTHLHIREFVFALKDRGLAPTSIRRCQSALRTYFGFLLAEGVLADDPTEMMESPRVMSAPDADHPMYWRDRAILEVLYASGMRVSELVGLKVRDLELDEGYALVFGKGSKERLAPLGGTAIGSLERYLAGVRAGLDRGQGKGVVFLNQRGRPLTRMTVWTVVSGSAQRAGLTQKVSPHTLRHTFATHLLEGGADLAAVQELLGHADISTTQIYTHVDREYLRDVHRKFHPRG